LLYMFVCTWDPAKRDEAMQRFVKWGSWAPKGMKEIGMWSDIWRGRGFRLCEITDPDPKVLLASNLPWSDIISIEAVQVLDSKQAMETVTAAMKLVPKK
jgi:hypothetical protein